MNAEEFLKKEHNELHSCLNALLGIYDRGVLLNDVLKAMEAYASQSNEEILTLLRLFNNELAKISSILPVTIKVNWNTTLEEIVKIIPPLPEKP